MCKRFFLMRPIWPPQLFNPRPQKGLWSEEIFFQKKRWILVFWGIHAKTFTHKLAHYEVAIATWQIGERHHHMKMTSTQKFSSMKLKNCAVYTIQRIMWYFLYSSDMLNIGDKSLTKQQPLYLFLLFLKASITFLKSMKLL